jgi:hypothetical protein
MRAFRPGPLAILLLLLSLSSPATAADVPNTLNLQGYLRDQAGEAVNSTIALTVRLYASRTASSALYTEVIPAVTVSSGRFKTLVGTITTLPAGLFSSQGGVWVGLSIDGGAELTRGRLASQPYTLSAQSATSASTADTATSALGLSCTGCVDDAALGDAVVTTAKLASDVADGFLGTGGDSMTGQLVALAGIDMSEQEAKNMRFQNSAAHPVACAPSQMGYVYFNTADQRLYICNGTTYFGVATGEAPDEDEDGIPNVVDNCLLISNADQSDTDGDGKGNACDLDDDNDGVADGSDNCPSAANADQLDTDSDGDGDACDSDDDGDGVLDASDNCPLLQNLGQEDLDGDGEGDTCDSDDDGAGVADDVDNSPRVANADQTDTDGDGEGDVSDTDDDGDGVADLADNCPLADNADQADHESDGLGDACDSDDDNDGTADGSDCAPQNSAVHPAATEACNSVDDDCDTETDEEDATSCQTYYYDGDEDSFGLSAAATRCLCAADAGTKHTTLVGNDCDDAVATVYPGATEECNSVDDDCDSETDENGVCDVLTTPVLSDFTPSSPSSNTSPALNGTADPELIVRIYTESDCSGSVAGSSTTAAGTGAFSVTVSAITNSSRTFYAQTEDLYSQLSNCSAGLAYVHDDQGPSAPTLSSTTPASPDQSTTPIVHGSTEADAGVAVYASSDCSGSPIGTGTAGGDGSFDVSVTVPSNATTNLYAKATDAAGNPGTCSAALGYTHDTNAPSAPLLVGTTPCSPAPGTTPTLFGTAEANGSLKIYTSSDCSGSPVATTAVDGGGDYDQHLTVGQNTTTTWYATVTDGAGNASDCSAGLTYESRTCDQVPPGYDKVWSGASSTGWSTAENWSPSGVPSSSSNVFICGDASNQPVLSANVSVNNLMVQGGSVDTNAKTLTVYGDLTGNGLGGTGTVSLAGSGRSLQGCNLPNVYINNNIVLGGRTTTNGNLTIPSAKRLTVGSRSIEIGGNLSVSVSNTSGDGLRMNTAGGEVIVAGAASFNTPSYNYSATGLGNLTAGTIRFRGSFSQSNGSSSPGQSFVSTGTKAVFDGTSSQSVSFANPGSSHSRFKDVEIRNTTGVTLSTSMFVTGRLEVLGGGSISGSNIYYTTKLPRVTSGSYTVTNTRTGASFSLSEDESLPAGTKLVTDSGYYIRLNGNRLDAAGDLSVSISNTSGDGLVLTNANDVMTVGGNATFHTPSYNYSATSVGNMSAGVVHFRGNFTQSNGSSSPGQSFVSTGTKVVFDGTSSQSVSFANPSASLSRFRDVDVSNTTGVTLSTGTYMTGRLDVVGGGSLGGANAYYTAILPRVSSGTYTVTNTRTAGTVTLSEDEALPSTTTLVVQSGTFLRLNGHELDAGGDLVVSVSNTSGDGLRMNDANDVLTVRGNATFSTPSYNYSATSVGNMSAGVIHFKGNFTQSNGSSSPGQSFVSTGTKAFFDGGVSQTISFQNPSASLSRFAALELDNAAPITVSGTVVADGDVTVTSGTSVHVTSAVDFNSDMAVTDGTLSVDGGSNIAGDVVVSSAGSVTLTGTATVVGQVDVTSTSAFNFGSCTFNGQVYVNTSSSMNGTNGYFTTRLPVIDNANSTYVVTNTYAWGSLTLPWDITLPSTTKLRVEASKQLILGGHQLEQGGDLHVVVSNTANDGLRLLDANDVMIVEGSSTFTIPSYNYSANGTGNLTAGELHLRGNLTQTTGSSSPGTVFVSTGTKVVFDGTSSQSVSFQNPSSGASRFDDVDVSNPTGVTLSTSAYVSGRLQVLSGGSLTGTNAYYTTTMPRVVSGTYTVTNTRTAGTVAMTEDEALPSTTHLRVDSASRIDVNGHTLDVGGPMTVSISNTSGDGLRLQTAGSRVNVGGNATFNTPSYNYSATSVGNLSAGEIRFRGNFSQTNGSSSPGQSFVSTGTKAVFDGTGSQTVSFSNPSSSLSRFAGVDVSNSAGATFSSTAYASGDLDLVGKMTVSSTFTLAGTMTLRSTGWLVNSGTVNVGGCVKESGHTITGTDPCP